MKWHFSSSRVAALAPDFDTRGLLERALDRRDLLSALERIVGSAR